MNLGEGMKIEMYIRKHTKRAFRLEITMLGGLHQVWSGLLLHETNGHASMAVIERGEQNGQDSGVRNCRNAVALSLMCPVLTYAYFRPVGSRRRHLDDASSRQANAPMLHECAVHRSYLSRVFYAAGIRSQCACARQGAT